MRKFGLILTFICIIIFNCAYQFPEKLPAPLDFDLYSFDKVKFGQTSVGEFAYLAPNYSKPETEGVYTIFSEKNLDNSYRAARIGFKDNFLDWIELEFAVPQSLTKLKQTYGKPKSVNTAYSSKFNYHDYGFFNIVTDKNNAVAVAVTLYGESDFNSSIKNFVDNMPDNKGYNAVKNLAPGKMMENEFSALYPNFPADKVSQNDAKSIYTVPSKYLRHNNYYSAINLVFSNGMLAFLNLKPKCMTIADIKQIYGEGKIIQNDESKSVEYTEYPNFIVVSDKSTTKVLNIGIISAD